MDRVLRFIFYTLYHCLYVHWALPYIFLSKAHFFDRLRRM